MKYETRTVRVGENVGPIDWTFDFRASFDSMGTTDARKDERCEQAKRWLRHIEANFRAGVPIRVTNYGGSPRCGIYPVIDVGMYDGWPYWRPFPSVKVQTWAGPDWIPFDNITDVYPGADGIETLASMERAKS